MKKVSVDRLSLSKVIFGLVLSLNLISFSGLRAEIQQIVMGWNALLCLNICIPMLQQQLSYIDNLTDLQINPRSGHAVMGWKPNYPFSYAPFNLATRTVGVRISDFRLKVRGTINHQQDNFYLISTGDNTAFLLVGAIRAEQGRYVVQSNIANHPLSANLRNQLQIASANQQIVEIDGPLFEPQRLWLVLEVAQIKFPKDAVMKPQYHP